MAIIIDYIRQYAPWIYGICAFVAVLQIRVIWLARRERLYAVFNLEREAALTRVYNAGITTLFLVAVLVGVYLLSTIVSEAVRPLIEADLPTATPAAGAPAGAPTTTPTLPLPDTTPTATQTKRPRPTARPLPTETPAATPTPAPQRPQCPDARAVISEPGLGAQLSGQIPISGVATHEQFSYYKLEYGSGPTPAVWSYFAGGDRPVQGGVLGTLNGGALPPGVYSVRIIVVDASGNFPTPCQTTFTIR